MYSESDIDGAVTAGVLSSQTATAFRNHGAQGRDAPAVDEEHFRLLTGFNDIFVSIALLLLLLAVAQIGDSLAIPLADGNRISLAGPLIAGGAWALAEFFTRRRRMALPSILLLLGFVGGVASAVASITVLAQPDASDQTRAVFTALIAAAAGGAAWLHWRRFAVPITIAALATAAVALVVSLVVAAVPEVRGAIWPVLLAAGVGVFALAMRWDLSDPERRTRRADVAFWLHLAAAPMIAHPVFQWLGVFDAEIGVGNAVLVLALYLVFAFVALAVDRRALLVSSLVYVLYAMYALIRTTGAVELSAALTGLVIGSALLSLSAFWQPMRRIVVGTLGDIGRRLPPVQTIAAI